ncbi:MAG: hypothetical protein H0T42_14355 [Deltaproteobacteria bacterium]|nr:hypothetical protein [Deltaproteobacteria bacterium]
MTGRFTQLGRQLRKLRHIVGGSPSAAMGTTLRRATQLACELASEHASEHAGVEDARAAFHDLGVRGILDPGLAERLAAATSEREDDVGERAAAIGGDLDAFLRSLERGAPAPELPFEAIVAREPAAASTRPDSTAGVPISGRILSLDVRGGLAVIAVDAQPIAMTRMSGELLTSLALAAAPTSRPEVHHEPTGATRVVWGPENLTVELAADFRRARVATPD